MTLEDVWISKFEEANRLDLTRFVFEYEESLYLSEWRKFKWALPVEVKKI